MNGTRFGDLPDDLADFERSAIAVLPVPYDRTSTWRKGADRGPAAILDASAHMELYDLPTRSDVSQRGIVTLEPLACREGPEVLAELVDRRVTNLLSSGKFPVVLGGEHSVSIGAILAAARLHDDLSVLQVDAHADTRQTYEGSPFNHACVMARAREVARIVQVGIRSMDESEAEYIDPTRFFPAHRIVGSDDPWMDQAIDRLSDHVYVTIDLDAFDSSIMPATGTPEPGGLDWRTVEALLERLCNSGKKVIGFDVVELLPTPGLHACDFLAAKLVYRFLSMIFADS